MKTITIHNAVREEWPALLAIHYRAIHEIASADYPVDILNSWHSPNKQPDLSDFDKKLKHGQSVVVAEIDNQLAGFGELVPEKNELLAVYVNPDYTRQGVGTAILHELECIALEKNLSFLQMDASLTAVPFYKAHGYQDVGRDVHILRPGVKMDCVKMKKILT
jgi:putative acetyltransferase